MTKKFIIILIALLVVFFGWKALTNSKKSEPAIKSRLKVVTTTTMVTDLVRGVVGGYMDIDPLMGVGVDPHLYKVSASDVMKLSDADLIFYNGLMLEGKMAEVFEKMKKRGVPVYAVSDSIPQDKLLGSDGVEGHPDPHVWLDAQLWGHCIDSVVQGASAADYVHSGAYEERGMALKNKYTKIHRWVQDRIKGLPISQRVLITSHDAYNYFGKAYGFQVIGIQGISTASEAGLADIARVVDFIQQQKIPAIFVESSVAPNVIERISQDSGATIGGELFSDAMGANGETYKAVDGQVFKLDTWEGAFKYNVDVILKNLEKG